MVAFTAFIEQTALGWYFIIAFALMWVWRKWRLAQTQLRTTYYELERAIYRQRSNAWVTSMVLLIEFALVIFGFQRVIAPTLRSYATEETQLVQPEDGIYVTEAPSFQSAAQISDEDVILNPTDPANAIQITPTLTPTPVGTILPNMPDPIGCDTDQAKLRIPTNGMVVFEPLEVIGQAYVDDFAFYKFELNGKSTFDQFAPLAEYSQPSQAETSLGQFVPSQYEPGQYQFRLNVFDLTGTARATCMVTIVISLPIPTPTPLTVQ